MFIAITTDYIALPRAIEVDAETIDSALARCVDIIESTHETTIHFLINKSTGDIKRVYRADDGAFKPHDSAFRHLGRATGQLFFENDKED